jgi:hypothetical protein
MQYVPLLEGVKWSMLIPFVFRLYVGSLHFNLTESDIKQVFEPFGELEFVDLHKDPMTGRSKGYAFVQYKRAEDAKMALEQMDGFELAGRSVSLCLPTLCHYAALISSFFSYASTLSMKKARPGIRNRILWTILEVCPFSYITSLNQLTAWLHRR